MPRFLGFIGPSYQLRSVNVDCQRCVNLYPEIDELGTGKAQEVASLVYTPGLNLLVNIDQGPIRGQFMTSVGRYFVVSYNNVYEVSSTFTATLIGSLSTYSGPVSMDDSGVRLAIVDGSKSGFFYKFSTNTFSSIPFPTDIAGYTFNGCDQVRFQDLTFIYNNKSTNYIFVSGTVGSVVADDSTIDPAQAAAAEATSSPIVSFISDHENLWLFKDQMAEVFYNTGDVGFPFSRIQGATVPVGCAAPFSLAHGNGTIFWLGGNDQGSGTVYMASSFQPVRISTHAVEAAIQSYSTISDATGYTYQKNGHAFYVLNFPSADSTWVFDLATKLWHERAYTNNGQLDRHRGDNHAFAFGKHVVGDYQNGNLYELSETTYTDNGAAITRMRISPHITNDLNRTFYSRFQLDIQSGVGSDGIGQGNDPQAILTWSNDSGHTWSSESWASMGKIGQTKARAIWRRLGAARDRVFKVVITDPVPVILIGAEIDSMAGGG